MTDTPHVFISHASEDKERFVVDFARRLRERHVDAWLDLWEMYPGDNLVRKIFDEGIKNADVIILVLSQNSIEKPWTREELDAAIVKRINSGCRLIPVVLDNCEVPEALKSTVWEKIDNVADYGPSLDRIISTIFGTREKPALGPTPAYPQLEVHGIPGFTRIDFIVLREFSRRALEKGDLLAIMTNDIWESISKLGISREDFRDSCTILCDKFMLERGRELAPEPRYYSLTEHGLDHYLQGREPEFWQHFDAACFALLNEGLTTKEELGTRLGISSLQARIILIIMQRRQYVRLREGIGGKATVTAILPALRRKFQGS